MIWIILGIFVALLLLVWIWCAIKLSSMEEKNRK